MISMMCSIWDDFKTWIIDGWSETTFVLVICVLGLLGLMALLSFFKKSFDKGKKPKWVVLILALILFGVLAFLSVIRMGKI